MKVLVTGGAGYIGSHTVQQLLKANHEVVVYDNLSTGFREAVPAQVTVVVGDVRDRELLVQTLRDHKIDSVIHFAAKLIVPESVVKPLEYYENNVLGTLRLLEACGQANVTRFVFSSTAAVYGNPQQTPVPETAAPAPMTPYGSSKLMSEQIIADYAAISKLRFVVLRYFNVAGAATTGDNGQRTKNATHLLKVASETASGKRNAIEIFGTDYPTSDGTCIRDYIHVDDLANAHIKALEYLVKEGHSETFNVGYGQGYSVREVLSTMKSASGVNFAVKESPRRAGDPATIVADSNKIRRILDWTPQHADLNFICKSAFEWEQKLR